MRPVPLIRTCWIAVAVLFCLVDPSETAGALFLDDHEPASVAATKPVDVVRTATPPTVDGRLDEPLWATATLVDDFRARLPVEGALPSERTEARFVYTARALYVGFRGYDSQAETIRAASLRRDDFAITGGDQLVVAIDSFRDLRSGTWFSTNPLGSRVDAQFADEGDRFEDSWNGVWAAAATVDGAGWSAELEIPWATLRFPAAPEVVMGINLFRRIPRTNEQVFAPLIPLTHAAGTPNVSLARPYRFRDISGGARLDLRPFVRAGTRRSSSRSRSALSGSVAERDAAEESDVDGGVFVRLPLSDAATLSATWRADFSEVEADDAVLDLGRFPLFLAEKREFFLEQAGLFTFGVPGEAELFTSRRIGLGRDANGTTVTLPIDWGLKGVARRGRFELGALAAETEDELGVGSRRFMVARPTWRVGSRSWLGGFAGRCSGAESATTTGVDASHVLAGHPLLAEARLRAFIAHDDRGEESARAWYAGVVRGGGRLAYRLSLLELGDGFEPCVGLIARGGTRRMEAGLDLPVFAPSSSAVRRYVVFTSFLRYDELAPERRAGFDEKAEVSFGVDWKSDFQLAAGVRRQRELLTTPFAIYRQVMVPAGSYERVEVFGFWLTDPTRALSGEGTWAAGELWGGDHLQVTAKGSWRPNQHFAVQPQLAVDHVELPGTEAFTAWVAQLRLGVTANARFRFDLVGQARSEDRNAGVGVRARYDLREGTGIVLAWDGVERRDPLAAPGTPWRTREERGALKIDLLLRF